MSNEETKARNGPERQEAPEQQTGPVDQAMWIDANNPGYVQALTIADATTFQDVTITPIPSNVLAANVANMIAYAQYLGVLIGQGPTV